MKDERELRTRVSAKKAGVPINLLPTRNTITIAIHHISIYWKLLKESRRIYQPGIGFVHDLPANGLHTQEYRRSLLKLATFEVSTVTNEAMLLINERSGTCNSIFVIFNWIYSKDLPLYNLPRWRNKDSTNHRKFQNSSTKSAVFLFDSTILFNFYSHTFT